jgi:hypothetical protein
MAFSMDATDWVRASLEDGIKTIQRGTWDGIDQNGKPFKPLNPRTVEMKEKGYARFPEKPLIDTTDMVSDQRFHITAGRKRGHVTHSSAAYLSHTRVPYQSKRGRVTKKKKSVYDYGLAHQYSKVARLPKREWWMDPGSDRHNEWRKRIRESLRQNIMKGATVIRGRTNLGERITRTG